MKVLMCAQGSPEWIDARCGRACSSRFGEILTPKTMKLSASAKPYAAELIAEKFLGGPDPWKWEGETADMRRGSRTESEARKYIAIVLNVEVQQVGCCIHDNDRWACSPDGLIFEDRGLELKCPAPKTQVLWLERNELPAEHKAQAHGGMIVTGRPHWTFVSYCLGLPPLVVEVERDEYTEQLEKALVEFNRIYDEMYARIKAQRADFIEERIDMQGDVDDPTLKAFVA